MSATLGGMTSQRTPVNHESAEGAQEQTVRRLPAGATDLTLENTELVSKSKNLGSKPDLRLAVGEQGGRLHNPEVGIIRRHPPRRQRCAASPVVQRDHLLSAAGCCQTRCQTRTP